MRTLSRKVIVPVALLVWFAPSLLLVPQLVSNGVRFGPAISLLPVMNGWALARFFAIKSPWSTEVVLLSAILPSLLLIGLLCSSYRGTLLISGAIVSCVLTACAYALLIA